MGFNYYTSLPDFVSNSDLGSLQKMLRCAEEMENLQVIYDFGNLVDALKTERHKFNPLTNEWTDDGGRVVRFDADTVNQAYDMVESLNNDPVLIKALDGALFQYVIVRKRHQFEYNGEVFHLPVRMKADAFKRRRLLTDIKTTGCESYSSFVQSITYFDYDRQGCFYLDVGEVDQILYVGVSKKKNKSGKHPVFKFLIERGDETYLSGQRKKNYLGWKYYNLIHSLNVKPGIIKL